MSLFSHSKYEKVRDVFRPWVMSAQAGICLDVDDPMVRVCGGRPRTALQASHPPLGSAPTNVSLKCVVPSARAQRPIYVASGFYHGGRSPRELSPLTTRLEVDEVCVRTVARAPTLARGTASMRAVL
jgi:hypothetical protein